MYMEDSLTPPPPPPAAPTTSTPPPTPNPAPQVPSQPADVPPPPPTPQTPPPSSVKQSPGMVIPSPKRSPLKAIFAILFILILLGGIGYAVSRFLQSRSTSAPKTLVYWGLWESPAIMQPVFAEFEKTHPNIKVQYEMQSLKEYRERLTSNLSQPNGPDIFRIHASWIPMFRSNLSPLPENIMAKSEFQSTFYPSALNAVNIGSDYYAMPLMHDALMLYVNDDLLQASGLSVPTNWDELRIAALSLSRCSTESGACEPGSRIEVSGVSLGTTDNVDHWQEVTSTLLLQNGVNLSSPATQAADDVFAYISNFANSYGVWSPEMPNSTTAFAQGKVAFYFGPSWRVFDIKSINPQLKFSTHPVPQLPYDPARNEQPVTAATFWVEGVNNKSANSAEAWELLKYLSSKEAQQLMFAQAKSQGRDFGEPYARVDLASELSSDQYLKSLISEAPNSKIWYLSSATQDGANGLNTLLSEQFAKAINSSSQSAGGLGFTSTQLSTEIGVILAKYGLTGVNAR